MTLKYIQDAVAFGDSHNCISRIQEADKAFLYKPPQNVVDDLSEFSAANYYAEMKKMLLQML